MSNEINSVDFIQDILTEKQKLVVFFNEKQEIESIVKLLDKFKEKVSNFSYSIYDNSKEENVVLAENLGATNTPFLMMFKAGNTNRWLENTQKVKLNTASILKFIGSPALYNKCSPEKAKEILKEITAEIKPKKEIKKNKEKKVLTKMKKPKIK